MRNQTTFLTAVFLCSALALLSTTTVTVALPAIQQELGVGIDDLQWIINSYTVCLASLALAGGVLGDRYGRRRLLLIGVVLYLAGSAACALADGIGLMLAGRVAQGVAAALLMPGSLSILARSTADPAARAKLLGWWGMFSGLAVVLGPTLGGVLVDAFGWPSIFVLNLPLGLLALVLVAVAVPESADPEHTALDPLGQLLGVVWLAVLSLGLIRAGRSGWDGTVWVLLAAGAAGALLFVVVELRQARPLLPVRLFADRSFAVAGWSSFVLGFGPYAVFFLLALYLQQGRGLNASAAGLWLLPMSLAIVISSPVSGKLTAAIGGRGTLLLGHGLAAAGMLGCLLLGTDSSPALALPLFVVLGLGMGLAMTPTNAIALGSVPRERSGLASAVVNSTRQTGTVVGIALLGTVLAMRSRAVPGPESVVSGLHLALLLASVVTLLAAAAAFLVPSPRVSAPERVPVNVRPKD